MSARHYRLSPLVAASLSLIVAGGLAGCGPERMAGNGVDAAAPRPANPPAAKAPADDIDVEANIFTVLGLAKRPSEMAQGPQVGAEVSPTLWQAAHDTLSFVKIASEDPMAGFLMSDWYTPARKPNQRLRISVFILSRALRSDSVTVRVERQERSATGQWQATPISRDTVAELENAILLRARTLRAERARETS